MAVSWKARLDSVAEIDGRAIIGMTVQKRDNGIVIQEVPYTRMYTNVEQMTIAQVITDVTAFAQTVASAGTAIDLLKTRIGDVLNLEV